jgi:cell division protein FtsB
MFLPIFIKKSVLVLLLIYSLYSLINTFFSIHSNVLQKDAEYKDKILGLKDEKNELEKKLITINSDDFVEKEARSRLNMKKEGEEVYLVSSNEAKKAEEVKYMETVPVISKNHSNFDKWMEILF